MGRLLGIELRTAGLGYLGVGSKLDRRRQAVAKLNLCATTAPSVLHAEMASLTCPIPASRVRQLWVEITVVGGIE